MVLVSYSGKEINAKIVFYGPGLCGKTTNLEYIYGSIPSTSRGKMVSMKTKTERTLFFDFLPLNLGELAGFKTRFLLYTVPGQVYYNATRKLVLKGVDAVIFVADSQRGKMDENVESFQNLEQNLAEHGLSLGDIPYVLQYNKRDLPDVYTVDELEHVLNKAGVPSFEAVATTGDGVFETFKACSKLLLARLSKEIGAAVVKSGGPAPSAVAEARAAASAEAGEKRVASEPSASEVPGFSLDELPGAQAVPAVEPAMGDARPRIERPAPAPASAAEAHPVTEHVAEQRKARGLWRWLRKDESGESNESPASAPAPEPEITWQPAPRPPAASQPAPRPAVAVSQPAPRPPAASQPAPRPTTAAPQPPSPPAPAPRPVEVPPETIEIDTRDQDDRHAEEDSWQSGPREQEDVPARMEATPAPPPADETAENAATGIPGLERSPFAAMAQWRPRSEKPAADQTGAPRPALRRLPDPPPALQLPPEPKAAEESPGTPPAPVELPADQGPAAQIPAAQGVAAQSPAAQDAPAQGATARSEAVRNAVRQDAMPRGASREMLRPFVAGPSGVEEIVVPVIIPRTSIRDRVEIRLVLRVVQELDAPEQRSDSREGPDTLAASA